MKKLKQKDLADFRSDLLIKQENVCPLCDQIIDAQDAVLDHCHTTGHIRRVLHRACNSSEGRVMKWAYSSKAYDPFLFLNRLIEYHKNDFTDMPIHPKHLTPNEKEIKRLKKYQKKLKTQKGKDRIQLKIDTLIKIEVKKE